MRLANRVRDLERAGGADDPERVLAVGPVAGADGLPPGVHRVEAVGWVMVTRDGAPPHPLAPPFRTGYTKIYLIDLLAEWRELMARV